MFLSLKLKIENRRTGGEAGKKLERKDHKRLLRRLRQPFEGEKCDERQLSDHENLPDMGSGPFVFLAGNAKHGEIAEQQGNRGK